MPDISQKPRTNNNKTPATAVARNKLAVPVTAARTPDNIIPKGVAAIASDINTELTLPCICAGTIVCKIVRSNTFAGATAKLIRKKHVAINQNQPNGVKAVKA